MNNNLKPCPFCGGRAELREGRSYSPFSEEMAWFRVQCATCGASLPEVGKMNLYYQSDAKEKAEEFRKLLINKWNRRW